jgi:hypothetical protein
MVHKYHKIQRFLLFLPFPFFFSFSYSDLWVGRKRCCIVQCCKLTRRCWFLSMDSIGIACVLCWVCYVWNLYFFYQLLNDFNDNQNSLWLFEFKWYLPIVYDLLQCSCKLLSYNVVYDLCPCLQTKWRWFLLIS